MVKAIALCRRRSTGSVLQLEIPPDIMAEATNIANKTESSDPDESVTMYLVQYIAHNCPNAGDWDVQVEPLFTIVSDGDDWDTIQDNNEFHRLHRQNFDSESIDKYFGEPDDEEAGPRGFDPPLDLPPKPPKGNDNG